MNKVVIWANWSGGVFSRKSVEYIRENYGEDIYSLPRHHPHLIYVTERFEKDSSWKVVEFKGDKYIIDSYDGWEGVVTPEDMQWIQVENK